MATEELVPEELGDVASRVLFENDHVRVWEMVLEPGERSDWHRHDLPYLMCVIDGASIDAEQVGKPRVSIPVQPGSVLFVPPGDTEVAINASDRTFREILIELKGAPADTPARVSVAGLRPTTAPQSTGQP